MIATAVATGLILHERTLRDLQNAANSNGHAWLLVGPAGMGKGSVARQLASQLLEVSPSKLDAHPYARTLSAGSDKSISIDAVRELEHYLSLRVPGARRRLVLVEDAHLLTAEAQNALLKMLEEPPAGTALILTTAREQALLPTIRSRLSTLQVQRPTGADLQAHFTQAGYAEASVRRALLMSGGLPGLMHALLQQDNEHPLIAAAQTAREIVQKPAFERLAMVDSLAKDKEHALNVLALLQQMAHLSLASAQAPKAWQQILSASYTAQEQLLQNAQPKLVLTNLMLSL